MKVPKQWFALIQTPVHSPNGGYPYCMRIVHAGMYPEVLKMYEAKRKAWNEGCTGHLTKREIELFSCNPPPGPRVHLVPVNIPYDAMVDLELK